MGLTFKSVDKILKLDHSYKSHWAVLSCGTVYYAVQGGSNFWVCGSNTKVWPFKGMLQRSSSTGRSTHRHRTMTGSKWGPCEHRTRARLPRQRLPQVSVVSTLWFRGHLRPTRKFNIRNLSSTRVGIHYCQGVVWGQCCLAEGCDERISRSCQIKNAANIGIKLVGLEDSFCGTFIVTARKKVTISTKVKKQLHSNYSWSKGAFHLSELTGQTIPIIMRISLLIKTIQPDQSNRK